MTDTTTGPKILVTFPGKFGDLLWALPTIRAIARRVDHPVDLLIPDQFRSIVPLLQQQEYLGKVSHDGAWEVRDTAPISPRIPPFPLPAPETETKPAGIQYDYVLHLGYRDWPTPDVMRHTLATANLELWEDHEGSLREEELDLATPWIQAPRPIPGSGLVICFTDEHFELKIGLTALMQSWSQGAVAFCTPESRMWQEGRAASPRLFCGGWEQYANWIAGSSAVLADCSAAHVLAVAMGKPVILMEPNPHRHNAVFYPLGKTGPQVILVMGTDGLPTFDARHVADALRAVLQKGS